MEKIAKSFVIFLLLLIVAIIVLLIININKETINKKEEKKEEVIIPQTNIDSIFRIEYNYIDFDVAKVTDFIADITFPIFYIEYDDHDAFDYDNMFELTGDSTYLERYLTICVNEDTFYNILQDSYNYKYDSYPVRQYQIVEKTIFNNGKYAFYHFIQEKQLYEHKD